MIFAIASMLAWMEVGGTLLASRLAFSPLLPMCVASQLKRRTEGLSMEDNYLLLLAHQLTAHSSKHTNNTLDVV